MVAQSVPERHAVTPVAPPRNGTWLRQWRPMPLFPASNSLLHCTGDKFRIDGERDAKWWFSDMDIGTDQRCLGPVDTEALRERILRQEPAAWTEQAVRQQVYEVHRDTESIVMLFCDESWPEGDIYRESGWDRLADVATPLIDEIIGTYYEPGGLLLRAMAARLKAGGRINPHRDKLHSFHIGHRVHVPITTNHAVRFTIGGRPYAFEVGNAYEINNQKVHSVMNLGRDDRITFIFDYVPPDRVPESTQTGKTIA